MQITTSPGPRRGSAADVSKPGAGGAAGALQSTPSPRAAQPRTGVLRLREAALGEPGAGITQPPHPIWGEKLRFRCALSGLHPACVRRRSPTAITAMAVPALTRVEAEDGGGGAEQLVAEHLAEHGGRAAARQRPLQRPQPEVAEVAVEAEGQQRHPPRLRPVGRLPPSPPPPQLLRRVPRREEPPVEQHVAEPGEAAHPSAEQRLGHCPPPLPPPPRGPARRRAGAAAALAVVVVPPPLRAAPAEGSSPPGLPLPGKADTPRPALCSASPRPRRPPAALGSRASVRVTMSSLGRRRSLCLLGFGLDAPCSIAATIK